MKVFLIILVVALMPGVARAATPTPLPTAQPSPLSANAKPAAGDVWLNEVLPNPLGTDTGNEWVELFNRNSALLDISGLTVVRLSGATIVTVPTGTLLAGGAYLKLMATGTIVNGGDILILKSGVTELDRVTYDDTGAEGYSWSRETADEGIWTESPTPGAANEFPGPDLAADTIDGGTSGGTTTAVTKASAAKTKTTAKKLPASGPSSMAYLIPLLVTAVYWYRYRRI